MSIDKQLLREELTFPPPDRTVPAMVAERARRCGDKTLFTFGDVNVSYAGLAERASRMAGVFADAGIKPGERIAILCGNRLEYVELFFGCAWAGIVAVPINTASRGKQLHHILADCGARLLIVEAALFANLEGLKAEGLAVSEIWAIDDGPASKAALPWPVRAVPKAVRPQPAHTARPSDILAILYTSGTTGPSKGVCCPHAQYYWWGVHTSALLEITRDDILLTCLPLCHTNAMNAMFQALLTCSTLVIIPKFSARNFCETLAQYQATVTYVLGAMVPFLLATPKSEWDRAHRVRLALAPAVPATFQKQAKERFGFKLLDGYGATETNFVIGVPYADQRPGLMGRVRPGFEARVVDEDDNEVPDGAAGELLIRATEPFSIATGYFGRAEATVAAWRNLWCHTGDRVLRDADGYFRFVDRLKDAIRRRGENISSVEVEQVLLGHPAVELASVYPVPSEFAEDEVMVSVIVRAGASLTAPELLDFCQPNLPYFAVPRFVVFEKDLPRTENGKVEKYKLRARGVTADTWDREKVGYQVKR